MEKQLLAAAASVSGRKDPRELGPLQLAYIGDTVHDLFVRGRLVAMGLTVGKMHRQAVRMVSAAAQARMLQAIEDDLTPEEADIARRGRNAHAKHSVPKHADPADYAYATGLEALWGYLYIKGESERLTTLMTAALARTEELWQKQSSR